MKMPYILYLASNSASRKKLLEQASIPFQSIDQYADESTVTLDQFFFDIVQQIALLKMQHAHVPAGSQEGDICFVLTADTLGLTKLGKVLCKPIDRDDAIHMLRDARPGTVTATGFCLRKLQWENNRWKTIKEIIDVDFAESIFDVPEKFIDFYLDTLPFLSVSGAISIEGFGGQFLRSINGSYETIVGLPMFKIRAALFDFSFYE